MQKLVVLIVAFAAFTLFVGEASAVETTPAKVGEACGANIQAAVLDLHAHTVVTRNVRGAEGMAARIGIDEKLSLLGRRHRHD